MKPNDSCPCGSGLKYKDCHGVGAKAVTVSAPPTPPSEGIIPAGPRPKLVTLQRPPTPEERSAAQARRRRLVAPGRKKLVLAYPPYSSVTTPPLGVAYLKGYIQRTLPDWKVKIIDTNLEAHQDFFRRLGQRQMFSKDALPGGISGEIALSRAAETFRGLHPEEFYDRTDRMVHYSLLWNSALRGVLYTNARQSQVFYDRAPMPETTIRHAELLLAERPTAIGISVCYLEQYWAAMCLAKVIRQRAPEIPILLGGTMFKEGIQPEWSPPLWPVDYIVCGAGELPVVEILAGRADACDTPGVTVVTGPQLKTTPPFYDTDFDAVGEADFSDFDRTAYYSPKSIFPIQTTRGCYWKRCTFCNHYKTVGGAYQLREMDGLVRELANHVASGTRHFTFVDDIIAPARFNKLSKAVLEAKLDIRYHAMTRPMKAFTREILQNMYDAGCRFIMWGVESGSQRVLDLMEKGTNVAEVEQCLAISAEVGIKNHVFIICGFPTETREEFQETIDFLARAKKNIHCVHKTIFGLEPGTPVFDNPEKFGVTRMWVKPSGFIYDFECSTGMNREQARKALDDARPFFRSFAAGKELEEGDFRFRDHLLLMYCRDDEFPKTDARLNGADARAG